MSFLFVILLFLMGMVAGICVALPYGPVGFLIIRRFYLFGMKSGMYSALGMALSDGFYAIVVGFGLHGILHFVKAYTLYGELALGILLVFIGVNSMKKKLELQVDEEMKHPTRDIASTFFINILNPSLIVWFALAFEIFAHIGHRHIDKVGTAVSIAGIVAGSCFLWFLIGQGIWFLRRRNRDELVQRINYITGGIITLLGVGILLLTVVKFL